MTPKALRRLDITERAVVLLVYLGGSAVMLPAWVIVSGGPYHWVRHPMYTGYAFTFIGLLCSEFVWWNLACYSISMVLMWIRISREEAPLSTDDVYPDHCLRVPYRLVRGVLYRGAGAARHEEGPRVGSGGPRRAGGRRPTVIRFGSG